MNHSNLRRNIVCALALASLLAVTACAGSDVKEATGDTDAAKTKDDAPSNREVKAYFDALAGDIPMQSSLLAPRSSSRFCG